ncbi:helix-turn-helix transcriptional regulator [Flavobacterium sp. RHBU_24]|uniref:helix-turn-helix transcriptional regulator n=1 Tax=Flavobacterium sp. RHBU_24 TaxID=3391185 RepID=UPI003984796E
MFGKNIKKIRSVHGLSQQQFAELFDLKRATLGAYEEDRSNPKIDTVLKIANHFSIALEELLTKELTVNQLLHFNEAITTGSGVNECASFPGILCITEEGKHNFIANFTDANSISSLQLPVICLPETSADDKLAYVVDDLTMSGTGGFLPKDVVVGSLVAESEYASANGQLVLVLTGTHIYFRQFIFQGEMAVLKASHHGVEPIALAVKEIKALWQVVHYFRYTLPTGENELEQRLAQLENTISALRKAPGW